MGYIDRGDDQLANSYGIAEHFEQDERGWRYFRDGWKAPVPVTPEERNRIIGWHENGALAMLGLVMIAVVTVFFAPLPWIDDMPTGVQKLAALVVIGLLLAGVWNVIENKAAASLLTRTPVAAPLDRHCLARRRLASMSWKRIIFGIVGFVALGVIWAMQDKSTWLVWAAPLSLSLHQAYQKWRFEQRTSGPTFP